MADDKRSSLSSQIVAGLVVAAVVGAISFIPGVFKWVAASVIDLWIHLRGTSWFPNWSVYLLVLMSIHTLVYWIARVTKPKGPNVTAYNQDTFLGLKWRWLYIAGRPANAWAFCPHCDTVLVYSEDTRQTVLTCETCARDLLQHEGDKDYLVQKIRRQIERKIRSGEWKQVVEIKP